MVNAVGGMRIVVLDGYTENPGDLSWDGFRALGNLTVYDRTNPADILSRVSDAEAVVTNKTPLTGPIIRTFLSGEPINVVNP